LGKTWPALDVAAGDPDLILAAADDYSPTAVEERDATLRIFFATTDIRDRAATAMRAQFSVVPVDIDDQDWARRQHLEPVQIGNITVFPAPPATTDHRTAITIVIPPSMGFGTGHHATTRLCLAALQTVDLHGTFALDVGTGSGLLAIAAVTLGAARALGIDDDADAIQAARENLDGNGVTSVEFAVGDLMKDALPAADVVLANLTGALVIRAAARLVKAVRPGGVLIISGVLAAEGDDVRRALTNLWPGADVKEASEDEWLAFTVGSVR